jgi:hypothetical protein
VALVAFADAATLVVPPTTDRGGLIAAIDQTSPGAGGTRYRTALARAAEAITSGQGAIVVITDLQQAGWEASDEGAVPDGVEVKVMEIAAPAQNLAITSVRRDGGAMVAGIHNYGVRAARVMTRLRVPATDGAMRDLSTQSLEIAPQSAANVRFTVPLPTRGGAEIRVDDRDGFQGDNARYVILDPPAPLRVFIVTAQPPDSSNDGLYVDRVLSVADEGRAFAPRVIEGRAFSSLPETEFSDAAAVVLLGTSTLDRAGRTRVAGFLSAGGRVLLTLGPDVDLATLADTIGTTLSVDEQTVESTGRTVTLVAADTRHPIFRPFSSPGGALGDVYVERYRRLKGEGAQSNVLARFSGGADALVEQAVGRGRLLVFASDLDNRWNRFPLNPAFVPWTIETAKYLTEGREQRSSFVIPDLPAGVPLQGGVHEFGGRRVAVNPDVRESNPARTTPEEFLRAISRSSEVEGTRAAVAAREQEERQRLWQYGLLAMLVALAGEGLIGRRAA